MPSPKRCARDIVVLVNLFRQIAEIGQRGITTFCNQSSFGGGGHDQIKHDAQLDEMVRRSQ